MVWGGGEERDFPSSLPRIRTHQNTELQGPTARIHFPCRRVPRQCLANLTPPLAFSPLTATPTPLLPRIFLPCGGDPGESPGLQESQEVSALGSS